MRVFKVIRLNSKLVKSSSIGHGEAIEHMVISNFVEVVKSRYFIWFEDIIKNDSILQVHFSFA